MKISEITKRNGVSLSELFAAAGTGDKLGPEAILTAELEIKYAGYFERERTHADRMTRMGEMRLEADLPYEGMKMLSFEARQKLAGVRPRTIAQASSIPGVSPNDLQNLVIEVERYRRR